MRFCIHPLMAALLWLVLALPLAAQDPQAAELAKSLSSGDAAARLEAADALATLLGRSAKREDAPIGRWHA